jgi:hypothetical protein
MCALRRGSSPVGARQPTSTQARINAYVSSWFGTAPDASAFLTDSPGPLPRGESLVENRFRQASPPPRTPLRAIAGLLLSWIEEMGIFGQRCFEEANKLGGLVAKMRLASIAQITSTEAATLKDSPELVAKLDAALGRIRDEFAPVPEPKPAIAPTPAGVEAPRVSVNSGDLPRRCMTTLADLIAQRSLFAGDLDATVRRITEAASSTLDIERVSVWFLNAPRTKIVCADLFERASARHSSGVELTASDFAPYFAALAGERTIAAHDANNDPRTRCFSEVYLKPLNIGALLDVPVWANGAMVGVICHEHVGASRRWSTDEETFAYVLSSLVALTLEQRVLVHPSLAPERSSAELEEVAPPS